MFDKEKFGSIIKRINDSYTTQYEFADCSGVNRTYLSQYINMKLNVPPKPKILEKIASASKGITTYDELMQICGYIQIDFTEHKVNNSLKSNSNIYTVPILISENGKLYETKEDVMLPSNLDYTHQYFGYRIDDDSMLPLVGAGDIAIIEKSDTYESGQTCLISIDSTNIIIRKIIDFNSYIELHTAFPYSQPLRISTKDKEKRNFKILGKVIRVENSSAFK